MKTITRTALILMTVGIGLAATGCPERRNIAEIEANPGRYQNKEVIIVGRVQNSFGLAIPGTRYGGGIYKVDDGTGSIWVVTEKAVPGRGAEVGVRGVVGSGVSWGGRTYGLGLYEKERKFRRR